MKEITQTVKDVLVLWFDIVTFKKRMHPIIRTFFILMTPALPLVIFGIALGEAAIKLDNNYLKK